MNIQSPSSAARFQAPAKPLRAAIYVRISSDPTGAGLGVTRQEEDCRALCARHGWQVSGVYSDNDVSAYSGKRRPEWERLNADVIAGHVQAIACWHVDRLTLAPRELEDVIDLAERHGVELATCTGEIDLSTPTGRLVARMLGAAAGTSRSTRPSGSAGRPARPPSRASPTPRSAATATHPTGPRSSRPKPK